MRLVKMCATGLMAIAMLAVPDDVCVAQNLGSLPTRNTIPMFNRLPKYNSVPRFNTIPSYNSLPKYNSISEFGMVPAYRRIPSHAPVPEYGSVLSYNSVPNYNLPPVYNSVQSWTGSRFEPAAKMSVEKNSTAERASQGSSKLQAGHMRLGIIYQGKPITRKWAIRGRGTTSFRVKSIRNGDPRLKFQFSDNQSVYQVITFWLDTSRPGIVEDKVIITTDLPNQSEIIREFSASIETLPKFPR